MLFISLAWLAITPGDVRKRGALDRSFVVRATNYRVLRRAEWAPGRVSALVGPNGAGKTTLLDVPELLRHALEQGITTAIANVQHGSAYFLRHLEASSDEPVTLGLDHGEVRWELELYPQGPGMAPLSAERTPDTLDVRINGRRKKDRRSVLRVAADQFPNDASLQALVAFVRGYRLYRSYHLWSIKRNGSQSSSDQFLHVNGTNVFTVLRNWFSKDGSRHRWEFVLDGVRAMFPDLVQNLDFDAVGLLVTARYQMPGSDAYLPISLAPYGLLTGLLHLTAIASADPGEALAIDELENSLHPHAIRHLLERAREWTDEHRVTLLIATHAPVVLDQFRDDPSQVFIIERHAPIVPTPLDKLRDPDWLAQFSIGDL